VILRPITTTVRSELFFFPSPVYSLPTLFFLAVISCCAFLARVGGALFFWASGLVFSCIGAFVDFLHDFLLALTGGLRRLVDSYR
jgi:hypothetical protein